jgi:hypothetical protein
MTSAVRADPGLIMNDCGGRVSADPGYWSQRVASTPHHPPFWFASGLAAIAGTDELACISQGLYDAICI